jgi:serine/threonine protein kinase
LDGSVTHRARGTDPFKSPEMLMAGAAAAAREQRGFDRRRRAGAGAASDVWSLGCLLFELVTGEQSWACHLQERCERVFDSAA